MCAALEAPRGHRHYVTMCIDFVRYVTMCVDLVRYITM